MKSIYIFLKDYKGVFLTIFFLWIIYLLITIFIANDFSLKLSSNINLESLGIFGDSFNVLTSLFTGLAFAGVIVSVILQTQELKETRTEFKGQKDALIAQRQEMKLQSFDNKFFQMLNLLREVELSLVLTYSGEKYKNKEVFSFLKFKFEKELEQVYLNDVNNKCLNSVKSSYFIETFREFNYAYDTTFKYYYINLFQVMSFVNSEMSDKLLAKKYMNIIRAQLSKKQLILLSYNAIGIIEKKDDKYKYLIEEYSFFEHLHFDDFCETFSIIRINKDILKEYNVNAFGKNIEFIKNLNES